MLPYAPLPLQLYNMTDTPSEMYLPFIKAPLVAYQQSETQEQRIAWLFRALSDINRIIACHEKRLGHLKKEVRQLDHDLKDIAQDLAAETVARIAADEQLQANIDAEEAARIAADEQLQANIDAEEAARIAGDEQLQNQIDFLGGVAEGVDAYMARKVREEFYNHILYALVENQDGSQTIEIEVPGFTIDVSDAPPTVTTQDIDSYISSSLALFEVHASIVLNKTSEFPQEYSAAVLGAKPQGGQRTNIEVYYLNTEDGMPEVNIPCTFSGTFAYGGFTRTANSITSSPVAWTIRLTNCRTSAQYTNAFSASVRLVRNPTAN